MNEEIVEMTKALASSLEAAQVMRDPEGDPFVFLHLTGAETALVVAGLVALSIYLTKAVVMTQKLGLDEALQMFTEDIEAINRLAEKLDEVTDVQLEDPK